MDTLAQKERLTPAEFRWVASFAETGNVKAFQILKKLTDRSDAKALAFMGLAHAVRASVADRSQPEDALYSRYCVKRETELVEASIQGPNPTGLERLLAEQISLDWLVLRSAEAALEQSREISFREAYWRQSRVDTAHARLMSSIKTLAQVRRLQIPNLLQVNIAEQQVNVAAGS